MKLPDRNDEYRRIDYELSHMFQSGFPRKVFTVIGYLAVAFPSMTAAEINKVIMELARAGMIEY